MDIRYIELKTGYNDNGPAWIGKVKESKSGKTIYFNDHAFQKHHGAFSNYIDIETGELLTREDEDGNLVDIKVHGQADLIPFLQNEENAEIREMIMKNVEMFVGS